MNPSEWLYSKDYSNHKLFLFLHFCWDLSLRQGLQYQTFRDDLKAISYLVFEISILARSTLTELFPSTALKSNLAEY